MEYNNDNIGGWGVKKGSIGPMMEHARNYLTNGIHITAFPEGARSTSGELQEFKDGLFRLACDSGAAIIPCVVAGTNRAWPLNSWLLDTATIVGIVGDAIPSTNQSPSQLKERVRIAMVSLKVKLPAVPQPRYTSQQRRAIRPSVDVPLPASPIDDTVDAMLTALDNNNNNPNTDGLATSSSSNDITVMTPLRSVRQTPPVPIRPLVPSLPPPPHDDDHATIVNDNNIESPVLTFPSATPSVSLFKSATAAAIGNGTTPVMVTSAVVAPAIESLDHNNNNDTNNSNTLSVPRRNLVTSILPITPPHTSTTTMTRASSSSILHDDIPMLSITLPPLSHPSPSSLTSRLSSSLHKTTLAPSSPSRVPMYYQRNIVSERSFFIITRIALII
jgi:hypothetical protein